MSLVLSLLSVLAILHPNYASTNTIRRLSQSNTNWYCVTGQTEYKTSDIKGNYQHVGTDVNNNDFWIMTLGAHCDNSRPKRYIRQSTLSGNTRYEITTKLAEDNYVTRCEDDATAPETCESWTSDNLGETCESWFYDPLGDFETCESWTNELTILEGKCPDIETKTSLTVSGAYYGCNGEFRKDKSINNFYRRNEIFVNPNWGDYEYYVWFFNYPTQSWGCFSTQEESDITEFHTTQSCSGGAVSGKLSFHN
eukprot:396642_1